ncbi:YibE/F family protein [Micromonospora sp. CPCC 205371]|nr:YibE/F family protein [Micromonospora sp. CPCC 205371]
MGSDHVHTPADSPAPAPPRVRKILAATVIPLFAVTVVATAILWPRDTPPAAQSDDEVARHHGTVTQVVEETCPPASELPSSVPQGPCGTVTVKVDDGPDKGKKVTAPIPAGPGAPEVGVGDDVVLVVLTDPEDPTVTQYNIADHQRGQPLVWLVVLFAAAIVGFARWRGLAALGGLAASFAILLIFVLPAIRAGEPPLLVAVVGAALIMFVVLYLTHGVNAQTSVAVLGTLASLVLTGVLGAIATAVTHLTGYGDENATTLAFVQSGVDLHGLLLAGIIIGSLGVLDDVTVTQAATVTELARANPSLGRLELYRAATRVGRAHIASTINTIVLAYAGASLPVLLLIVAAGRAVTDSLTTEFLAQEIVRSVVATMGLIAAVPITTALAAVVAATGKRRSRRSSRPRSDSDAALAALSQHRDEWA